MITPDAETYRCPHCDSDVTWLGDDDTGRWMHVDGRPLCTWIEPTPVRERLAFNVWRRPFPGLLHRVTVRGTEGFCSAFWSRRSAEAYVREVEALEEAE